MTAAQELMRQHALKLYPCVDHDWVTIAVQATQHEGGISMRVCRRCDLRKSFRFHLDQDNTGISYSEIDQALLWEEL